MQLRDNLKFIEALQDNKLLVFLAVDDLVVTTHEGSADWYQREFGANVFSKSVHANDSTTISALKQCEFCTLPRVALLTIE